MVKVCHMLDTLNLGGLEKVAIDIVLNLKGYEHSVWCLKDKGVLAGQLEGKNVPVTAFNFEGPLTLPSVSRLVRELKKEKFTVIHCHGLFPSDWARVAAIFARIPVRFVHCHSTYYGITLKERIKLLALSFSTTRIFAVSEAVKKSLTGYVGISGRKITVIYNGIEDLRAKVHKSRDDVRAGLGLGQTDFVIGCVGRLVQLKGHRYLIDAVARVRERFPNCTCLIIGDGPEQEAINTQIEELKLGGAVQLLGTRIDIADLLSALDLVVAPSIVKEGLPLVLAEAAAMSLPLVATNIGGSPEIVKDGDNGFIVEPKDVPGLAEKIMHLFEHDTERRAMARRSREIWEARFTRERMMRAIEQIYRESLEKLKVRKR